MKRVLIATKNGQSENTYRPHPALIVGAVKIVAFVRRALERVEQQIEVENHRSSDMDSGYHTTNLELIDSYVGNALWELDGLEVGISEEELHIEEVNALTVARRKQ